jgi:tetratricopeptide (TPR) repeat protein
MTLSGRVPLYAVCLLVLGFYAWCARPDVWQMSVWNADKPASYDPASAYYNLLVQGFRSGQLNLKREVPSGLAKLADPYDLVANAPYRDKDKLLDLSFYKGKLYLYFGVTPALVLFWPYAVLTGHYLFHKEAVAIFCSVGFLLSVALLSALRRRYFPEVSGIVVIAGALALGLVNCVPVMLQHPDVYEVAISCAYAMVMLALLGIWQTLHDPVRQCRWLAAASLAYGLAVGARPNLLFGAVILLVPVVHAWISISAGDRPRWLAVTSLLAAAVVPISFVGAGLMLYNYLRFDNPFEFGMYYAITGINVRAPMFDLKFIWFNFRVYFLQQIHWSSSFPFVEGIKLSPAPTGQLYIDNLFGVLPNLPFVGLALAAPLAWQKRPPSERSALRLFMAALAVFSGFSALTLCFFGAACLRYQVDFMPALVLLAVCGVIGLERTLVGKPLWRSMARWAWAMALIFSVVVSLLVSVRHYAEERLHAGLDQLYLMDRPQGALPYFEQALRIEPDYVEAHNNLGNALVNIPGRMPEAISHYETALQIQPDNAKIHDNLGLALSSIPGRMPEAISEYEAALRIEPDLAEVHYNLGNAFARLGQWPEAMAEYEAALRLDPGYAEAHGNLGNVLLGLPGRLPDAIAQYEAALRLKPDSAETHFNLGNALLQMPGRLPDAMAEFQTALRLKPDFAPAQEALDRLQRPRLSSEK